MSSATAFPATGAEGRRYRQYRRDPILDGWHGDTSRMYLVGDVPIKARRWSTSPMNA
jgi:hypothetical protein